MEVRPRFDNQRDLQITLMAKKAQFISLRFTCHKFFRAILSKQL